MRFPVLLSVLLVPCASLHAQAPEAFQYQAVARDAGGGAIANTAVGVQFLLHQGNALGTVVYAETHAPTTNANGLFTVEVGNGTPSAGTFSAIDWSAGPYFLEVGMDPTGGTSYVSIGTQQLLSVPYALYAKDVANKDDADADPANELQTISFANDSLQLSQNGGKVDLSTLRDDDDWVRTGDTLHNNGRRVGIGTTTPDTTLHVVGGIKYQDGSQGNKRLLTSDADGNASWHDLSSESIFGNGNLPAPDLSCLSMTGSLGLGSAPRSVAVSGNYAYVVDYGSHDLKVIDISDLATPTLVGSLSLGSAPWCVAVAGNYAYVVDQITHDLKVIDISDPSAPALSGSLGIGTVPISVAVSGNYAYVVDSGTDDLKVIDISDPAAPTLTGSIGLGSIPNSVAVLGNYAYVVEQGPSDLRVIDISDPSAPTLSGSLGLGPIPKAVAVSGSYVYVVDGGSDDLKVIDVSDPATPTLTGSLGIGSGPESVAVSGDYAIAVDQITNDLKVIDISDPATPTLSGSLGIGSLPFSVAVSGNHAYAVDLASLDLKVIELFCQTAVTIDPITGAFNTQTLSEIDTGWELDGNELHNTNSGNVGIGTSAPDTTLHVVGGLHMEGGLHVEGGLKYQDGAQADKKILTSDADGNASWQSLTPEGIFGSGNAPAPDLSCLATVGSLGMGTPPTSVAVSGNYAYVVVPGTPGLKVIDISDPAAPAQTGSLAFGSSPRACAVSGNYAYVVDPAADELFVVDVSDPTAPTLTGSLGVGTNVYMVAVSGNYAYVVDGGTDDLKVIDVSDPAAPALTGSLGLGNTPHSVAVSGNYAYVVDLSSDDLKVIDISNPSLPVLTGSLGMGTYPYFVAVQGSYAYVVDGQTNDLSVIDISNPAAPALSGSLGIGSNAQEVVVLGNFAYVVDPTTDDLKVIDISDPSAPILSNSLGFATGTPTTGPVSVAVSGNYAYVVDNNSDDLKVIRIACFGSLTYDPMTGSLNNTPVHWQSDGNSISNTNNGDALINGLTIGRGGGNQDSNTALGTDALDQNTTGTNNTAVGHGADVALAALSNATALGANAVVNNSDRMVLGNNVSVGIGISDPAPNSDLGSLHVQRNLILGSGNTNDSYIVGDLNLNVMSEAEVRIVSDANDNSGNAVSDIIFGAGTNSSTFGTTMAGYGSTPRNEFMRIDGATGNVGIGTNAPTEKLHVDGNVLSEGNVLVDGNVGIGTNAPSEKLHVAGNAQVDGSIEVDYTIKAHDSNGLRLTTSNGTTGLNIDDGTGHVGIGAFFDSNSSLYVHGGIMTRYSGTTVTSSIPSGTVETTVTINVAGYQFPPDWYGTGAGEGAVVMASVADGCYASVVKAKVINWFQIQVVLRNICSGGGPIRVNWVVFGL
ncbi:MAG: hypothetical protein H6595_02015 [Flavobacteriales bacterium]|nr:hypothetical protein [Flavobacteriales bacterium]